MKARSILHLFGVILFNKSQKLSKVPENAMKKNSYGPKLCQQGAHRSVLRKWTRINFNIDFKALISQKNGHFGAF